MSTASESRAALIVITSAAVSDAERLASSLTGPPELQRAALLEAVPSIIAYYSDGSSALAADFYDDERELAGARGSFTAEPIIVDRVEKIRNAIAWAAQPMFEPSDATVVGRLAEVVQLEAARPHRDTITTNRRRDPEAVGWRRVASGGCKFCSMLAAKGSIYRESTVRFAAHPNCHCTAWPAFRSNDDGSEVGVIEYVASQRRRSAKEKAKLREYMNEHFPHAHG